MFSLELVVILSLSIISCGEKSHPISKRSLLFPRATQLQVTYGVSAPAILPRRSINLSLCVQVNYDLPYNLTHLVQTRIITAKSNNEDGFDLSRETFYKYIVNFLNSFGLNGDQCLYRLICEMSEYPMHLDHKENLLEKIVHFIFTPSLEFGSGSSQSFSSSLLEAEYLGRRDGKCDSIYSECFVSLASLFTNKFII